MTQNGSKLRKGNLLLNIQVQFRLLLFSSNNTSLVAHFQMNLKTDSVRIRLVIYSF